LLAQFVVAERGVQFLRNLHDFSFYVFDFLPFCFNSGSAKPGIP